MTTPVSWMAKAASLSLRIKVILGVGAISLAILATAAFLVVTGATAAFQAREQLLRSEEELSTKGLSDFTEAGTYASLYGQFQTAERSAARAKSRLGFTGIFTWAPVAGGRLRESLIQLEIAHLLARAGSGLTASFHDALAPDTVSRQSSGQQSAGRSGEDVTRALEKSAPVLAQVERDLDQAGELLLDLNHRNLDNPYIQVLDRYLPQIRTLVYISREQPSVIGRGYELNLELSDISRLVADPLEVIENAEAVNTKFTGIIENARQMALDLAQLERDTNEQFFSLEETGKENGKETPEERRRSTLETIGLMGQTSTLIEQSATGAQGLLGLALAMVDHGLFSKEFAAAAGTSLARADSGLAFAQAEAAALRLSLEHRTDGNGESQGGQSFGAGFGLTPSSLDWVDQALEQASASTRFLSGTLGFRGPRRYLLLLQNQEEIKATGGYIGQVARLEVEEGELTGLVFQDTSAVDFLPPTFPNNPAPPQPVYWYLWMERLLFRDANWSPDFPTSAALLADMYQLGQGVQLDGVIAGSKRLLIELVEYFGDIRVPDLPEPLTRESVQAYSAPTLPYQCSERHASPTGRRCFDEDAFFAIKDRLTSPLSANERTGVMSIFRSNLDRRNILAHIFNPDSGDLLWELGWNGAIPPVDHDYLSVVDSSFASHTAEDVVRTWDYQVTLRVDRPLESRLRVRYDYQGDKPFNQVCRQSEEGGSNCHWNYFRIYLPAAASNVEAPPVPLNPGAEKLIWGYPDPDSLSLGLSTDVGPAPLTEVGGLIAVPPDSVMTVPLSYQLPWRTVRSLGDNNYEYRLLVQKQPGIDSDIVNVSVELPPGSELIDSAPMPRGRRGDWIGFQFDLDADTVVVVSFRTPDSS